MVSTCWPPPPDTWRDRSTEPPGDPVRARSRRRTGTFTDRRRGPGADGTLLRERRALENYAPSRKPERGLPVADSQAVLRFLRALLRDRKRVFVVLVVLNGLAAVAGLVVPRILGALVDRTVAGDAASSLNTWPCWWSASSARRRC